MRAWRCGHLTCDPGRPATLLAGGRLVRRGMAPRGATTTRVRHDLLGRPAPGPTEVVPPRAAHAARRNSSTACDDGTAGFSFQPVGAR